MYVYDNHIYENIGGRFDFRGLKCFANKIV